MHVAGWLSAVVEGCEDMPNTVASVSASASASAASYSSASISASASASASADMSGGSQGRGQGPGLLDALESTQPQLALAAEQGRGFLCALLTFPAVQHYLEEEGGEGEGDCVGTGSGSGSGLQMPGSGSGRDSGRDSESEGEGASGLWAIVREASAMVAAQGMSEDRHLCLFRGGWKVNLSISLFPSHFHALVLCLTGLCYHDLSRINCHLVCSSLLACFSVAQGLLRWCQSHPLLSPPAALRCRTYIEAVAHVRDVHNAHKGAGGLALGETDDSVLLLDAFVYDFPLLAGPEGGVDMGGCAAAPSGGSCSGSGGGGGRGADEDASSRPSATAIAAVCDASATVGDVMDVAAWDGVGEGTMQYDPDLEDPDNWLMGADE